MISHDLDLLDEAITRVLHLDRPDENATGHLVEYKGTYSQYVAARAADEVRLTKLAERQAKEIARMQRFVDRFGAKASKASLAHSMEKRIARLEAEKVDEPRGAKALRVRFPPPPTPGRTVIEVAGLTKSYTGPPVFADVDFDLGRGERLLVLGLNGAGKTSLLRILAGETRPTGARSTFGHNVTLGYYAQEHDNLRIDESLLDNIRREVPLGIELTETQLRGLLGMFGLSGEKVFQEAGTLSGGEKTKLALAMLMVGRNNLLLLDEPTNNLDPASRQAVADALGDWPGAIIFVSHDTEFVEQLAPDQGAADARRRRRLLRARLARARRCSPDAIVSVAIGRIGPIAGRTERAADRVPSPTHAHRGVRRERSTTGTIDDVVEEARRAEADGFASYWSPTDLRPRRPHRARRRRARGAAHRARHERRADLPAPPDGARPAGPDDERGQPAGDCASASA